MDALICLDDRLSDEARIPTKEDFGLLQRHWVSDSASNVIFELAVVLGFGIEVEVALFLGDALRLFQCCRTIACVQRHLANEGLHLMEFEIDLSDSLSKVAGDLLI
ncbi:hypothetical protein D3C71_1578510 [compost metagenome]